MKKALSMLATTAVITIVLFVFATAIYYGAGYVGGLILSAVAGEQIATTLNSVFNVTYFTADMIPSMCGILAVIGNFLKTVVNNSKEKNN